MSHKALIADNIEVTRSYKSQKVTILRNLCCEFWYGNVNVIVGPSGSGKSTLLDCLALHKIPSRGDIFVDGILASTLSLKKRFEHISNKIAYIDQNSTIISYLSVEENISLALNRKGQCLSNILNGDLIKTFKLSEKKLQIAGTLSGGERQRLCILIAIERNTDILICDEITSNLDEELVNIVVELLKYLRDRGKCIIISTHDSRILQIGDKIVTIKPV